MNDIDSPSPGRRRSHRVALVLLGTAGVVGIATAYDAWRKAEQPQDAEAVPAPAPQPVASDRDYSNNEYFPGIGYYHAPYHAWYPHPYNYYEPGRGYYAGGLWQALPWALAFSQSRPNGDAVAAALAAQRAYREQQQQQQQQQSRSSGFWGRTFGGSHFSSSRPTSAPAAPSHSIIRGGFGGSAHPAGS